MDEKRDDKNVRYGNGQSTNGDSTYPHSVVNKSNRELKDESMGGEKTKENPGDNTEAVNNLLVHMRQVRTAIPVNQLLREELRGRLLEQKLGSTGYYYTGLSLRQEEENNTYRENEKAEIATMNNRFSTIFKGASSQKYCWGFLVVILVVIVLSIWRFSGSTKVLEAGPSRIIMRLWMDGSSLDLAAGPEKEGLILTRDKGLLLTDYDGNSIGFIQSPAGYTYLSPAWLNKQGTSGELALVQQAEGDGEAIILVNIPIREDTGQIDQEQLKNNLQKAEPIYLAKPGYHVDDLAWSFTGDMLAFTLEDSQGNFEICLLTRKKEIRRLGTGKNPTWSPDGKYLVVERSGNEKTAELWLLSCDGQHEKFLTDGKNPVWGGRGYMVYVQPKDTERVLTYTPEGVPLFTVLQRVEEIRAIHLGRGGYELDQIILEKKSLPESHLLVASINRLDSEVLSWLQQLELAGVQEPRTLLLEQINQFYGIKFGPEAKTLLFIKPEANMLTVNQVGLQEKLMKAGD